MAATVECVRLHDAVVCDGEVFRRAGAAAHRRRSLTTQALFPYPPPRAAVLLRLLRRGSLVVGQRSRTKQRPWMCGPAEGSRRGSGRGDGGGW